MSDPKSQAALKDRPVRELHLALPDVSFDEIVQILKKVWIVPDLPGIKGCNPCRSGFDRLIIEDPAFRQFRR